MNLVPFLSRRRSLGIALAIALGGVALHAQRPQGGAPAELTIDFNAVTADGKPVQDLTPADVVVRIGGKPRTITSLTLKTVGDAAPGAEAAPTVDTASPPFATNEPKPPVAGRSVLIVVDTESLRAGTEGGFKAAIEALLKGLGSADRVALSTAPRDTAQVGLGTSMVKVREAVAALRGQRPASVSNADSLCRTKDTLGLLNGLVSQFTGSEKPTSVVFIAGSMSTPGSATGSSGRCEVVNEDYNVMAGAVTASRVNLYIVQGDPGTMGQDSGLQNLAGVTGAGQVLRVVEEGFAARVLADSSAYWVASIAPDPGDRPGTQRLELKAAREGVTVRTRPEALIPRPAAAAGAKPGGGGGGGAKTPKEMLATTAPFTDLQLRAVAYSTRGAADKMNVLVYAEPVDPTVKITAMTVGFFDQAGKGGSLPAPQIANLPITTLLPLGIGEYRLRVAATDSTGKSGAVDVPVNTALVGTGAIKLGGLLLGAQTEKGVAPRVSFSTEEKVIAALDIFGTFTAQISAKFELAKTDVGPAIQTLGAAGGGATNEPDKISIFGEIPIAKLEPGDYVIRVIVQMQGAPEVVTMRSFRKLAK